MSISSHFPGISDVDGPRTLPRNIKRYHEERCVLDKIHSLGIEGKIAEAKTFLSQEEKRGVFTTSIDLPTRVLLIDFHIKQKFQQQAENAIRYWSSSGERKKNARKIIQQS